jgi:molecular chaperone GrpE
MKFRKKESSELKDENLNPETQSVPVEDVGTEETPVDETPKNNDKKVKTSEVDELKEQIEKLTTQVDELRDLLARRVAEIDNIKRRHREESLKTWSDAEGRFITSLLPIIDNFDRAAEIAPKTEDKQKVIDGFVLIHDSLAKLLEQKGLQKIEAKGKPFDYNLHNAIMRQPNADLEPDTVIEEVLTGYIYRDMILRHTNVIISELPEDETAISSEEETVN